MQKPVLPSSSFSSFLHRPQQLSRLFFLLLTLVSFSKVYGSNTSALKVAMPVSDTLIEASICDGDTYAFNGELLEQAGTYTANYTAADGSDSTVTLVLNVLPHAFTHLEESICEGTTYEFNGEALSQSGTYSVVLPAANGCDSTVTLVLKVLPIQHTHLSAAICKGSSYAFQGDLLSDEGVYSAILSSVDGCDSIVTLELSVVTHFETNLQVSVCNGQSYVFNGDTLSASGTYVDSLKAIGGCDSLVTLKLNVLPEIITEREVGICVGSSYVFNGDTLSDDGIYKAIYKAANGCDSTVVLHLSVVASFDVSAEAVICTGDEYLFGGAVIKEAGEYSHLFTAIGGCDSLVTLTVTELPVATGTDEATICFGGLFEYQGELLTDAGEYTFVLDGQGANGCDSIVTFTLHVMPEISSSFEQTICDGETLEFDGEILSAAGDYEANLTAANGCDSIVTLHLHVLPQQHTAIEAFICEGETYAYNGDTLSGAGTYTFVYEAENGCDSTVTLQLGVYPREKTTLEASICAGETYGFNGADLSDAGIYTADYSTVHGCDSTVTLVLSVLPVYHDTISATICGNETYTFNGDELNASGAYDALFQSENGCDSTVTLILEVLPTQHTTLQATICEGKSYNYYGLSVTVAGEYDFIFQGENGCDSVVTLVLDVLPSPKTSLPVTICAGESYEYEGDALTVSGDYPYVYPAENGCDSTVTIQLTVLPVSSSVTELTLCTGSSYVFGNDTLTDSGVYTQVLTGANGCDSTATLVLEFVNMFNTSLQASVCAGEAYIFENDTLTAAGDYTHVLSAQGGCDSLVTLTLSILPKLESSSDVSICAGESYNFNGLTLSDAGTYSAVLTGSNGCDSTAVVHLTVLPLSSGAIEATICANESYPFNGQILHDAGVYVMHLTGVNGCDSTLTLTLNVLPVQNSTVSATICGGDTYNFHGQTLEQSGTYTATLPSVNGCDSIITLHLTVLPLAQSAFAATVCNGAPYVYNGQTFTQSGTYHFVYDNAGANGCDSLETLFLVIFPNIPPVDIFASICEGNSYPFNGSLLNSSGTYTAELSSTVGCDSVVVLHLTVNPAAHTDLNASICKGESYNFNGEILTAAGDYSQTLSSSGSCDSIVTLHLEVITVNAAVTQQGHTLVAQATNATFQWINCDTGQPVAGATGSSFTPATSGNYAVLVTQNGCTALSSCTNVQVVGVHEAAGAQAWSIQPNPAVSFTQLRFAEGLSGTALLNVVDASGRSLMQSTIEAGVTEYRLDMNDLPDGVLFLQLVTEAGISTKRLVKSAE